MSARVLPLALSLLAGPLFAQSIALPPTAAACGPGGQKLNVKTSDDITLPAPDSSKANIVLIEDQLEERPEHGVCPACTTRVQLGMDGQWIAATSGFSHTFISVAPGAHHFCANGSDHFFTSSPLPSFMPMRLEAGKTYYFRARIAYYRSVNLQVLDLSEINEDEGRFLVSVSKKATLVR